MKTSKIRLLMLVLSLILILLAGCNPTERKTEKPVIYLYPTSQQIVSVKLDYKGELTCTYPEYKG